ncbi:cache domain-containing protein [Achromobacter xylosoxidans]
MPLPSAFPPTQPDPDAIGPRRLPAWAWILLALVAVAAVFGILHAASQWAREGALKEAYQQARSAGQINAALLRNNLDKFRALPFVLTRDVDLRATLQAPSAAQIEALDEKLDTLSRGVGASAIYVLDRSGYAIAASNWREPATFVGVDYQFRPYFRGAVAHGSAEHFALGTVSHEAGLYLSRRVDDANGAMLGVVVLKVDFRDLEADWRQSNAPIFVTDEHGVVLLGSVPDWRFRVVAPLAPDLAQTLRTSLQFGDAMFQPLPLQPPLQTISGGQLVRAGEALPQIPASAPLLHTTLPIVESPGWTLHLLSPVQSALNRATANAQLGALLAQGVLSAVVGILLYRRHRGRSAARSNWPYVSNWPRRSRNAPRSCARPISNWSRRWTNANAPKRACTPCRTNWCRPASSRYWDRWPPAWRMKSTSRWPPSAPMPTTPPNSCAGATIPRSRKTWPPSPRLQNASAI